MRAACLVLVLLLAGCSEAPAVEPEPEPVPDTPQLYGFVVDDALVPVVGATISIPTENRTATTDQNGRYALDELPVEVPLTLIAEADGFTPASKNLAVPQDESVILNFSLERIPVKEPYMEVQSYNAFISCGAAASADEDQTNYQCGDLAGEDNRVWEFSVGADVAGIVLEAAWDAGSDQAEHLRLIAETVGFGDLNTVLDDVEGQSILRANVNRASSDRFYSDGGIVRLTIEPATGADEEEAGIGSAFYFQQDVQLFASIFYVQGPSPTYSVANA